MWFPGNTRGARGTLEEPGEHKRRGGQSSQSITCITVRNQGSLRDNLEVFRHSSIALLLEQFAFLRTSRVRTTSHSLGSSSLSQPSSGQASVFLPGRHFDSNQTTTSQAAVGSLATSLPSMPHASALVSINPDCQYKLCICIPHQG